jgi:hypothetical protein
MQMRVGLDDHRGHGVSSGGLVLGEQDDLVRARARVRTSQGQAWGQGQGWG